MSAYREAEERPSFPELRPPPSYRLGAWLKTNAKRIAASVGVTALGWACSAVIGSCNEAEARHEVERQARDEQKAAEHDKLLTFEHDCLKQVGHLKRFETDPGRFFCAAPDGHMIEVSP